MFLSERQHREVSDVMIKWCQDYSVLTFETHQSVYLQDTQQNNMEELELFPCVELFPDSSIAIGIWPHSSFLLTTPTTQM